MKNMRLTVCIGIMCGWLAAGMLHAGTRPDHVRPVEEDGSRLWLPVIRPVEGAEVEITYKGKELEVQEPIKIEELLKKEIDNSKYKVVGCIFNNEYQNFEYVVI